MTNVSHLAFLSRYCSPSAVKDGAPKANAFWIRPTEEYLSVNVLPGDLGVDAGLAQIRRILAKKRYNTGPNGRFAVFNAGRVIRHTREYEGLDVRIEHMPSPDDPTHAGIAPAGGYDSNAWHESTFGMALALAQFSRETPTSCTWHGDPDAVTAELSGSSGRPDPCIGRSSTNLDYVRRTVRPCVNSPAH